MLHTILRCSDVECEPPFFNMDSQLDIVSDVTYALILNLLSIHETITINFLKKDQVKLLIRKYIVIILRSLPLSVFCLISFFLGKYYSSET